MYVFCGIRFNCILRNTLLASLPAKPAQRPYPGHIHPPANSAARPDVVTPMPHQHDSPSDEASDDALVHDINRITREIDALNDEVGTLRDRRALLIRQLSDRGLSLRRIEQATGISVGALQKALVRGDATNKDLHDTQPGSPTRH